MAVLQVTASVTCLPPEAITYVFELQTSPISLQGKWHIYKNMNVLQSLQCNHARASLCKSISKALLDDPSTVKHLNETDEDVLYACRHTYGTSANLVVYRVDTVLNRLLQLQPALIHEKLDGLKCKHVAKRDKQKFLQFSYKERAWQSSKKVQKQRHQYWTRACERKAASEAEVLDAIENMRNACFESMGEWSDREDAPSSSAEFEVW